MCFSPYLGVGGGAGGLPRGLGHNLLMQFFSLGSSKMEISETDFFDTLTIQNDQISYAKHVVAPSLCVFRTIWVLRGGGLPRGLGHNLLMQYSRLGSSRMVVPLPSSRCLAEGNRISPLRKVAKISLGEILAYQFHPSPQQQALCFLRRARRDYERA